MLSKTVTKIILGLAMHSPVRPMLPEATQQPASSAPTSHSSGSSAWRVALKNIAAFGGFNDMELSKHKKLIIANDPAFAKESGCMPFEDLCTLLGVPQPDLEKVMPVDFTDAMQKLHSKTIRPSINKKTSDRLLATLGSFTYPETVRYRVFCHLQLAQLDSEKRVYKRLWDAPSEVVKAAEIYKALEGYISNYPDFDDPAIRIIRNINGSTYLLKTYDSPQNVLPKWLKIARQGSSMLGHLDKIQASTIGDQEAQCIKAIEDAIEALKKLEVVPCPEPKLLTLEESERDASTRLETPASSSGTRPPVSSASTSPHTRAPLIPVTPTTLNGPTVEDSTLLGSLGNLLLDLLTDFSALLWLLADDCLTLLGLVGGFLSLLPLFCRLTYYFWP